MHIQRKGTKAKALSDAQERRNRRIASPCARVEQVFAGLAQLGGKTLRSIDLARATLHVNLKAATLSKSPVIRGAQHLTDRRIQVTRASPCVICNLANRNFSQT